MVIMEKPIIKTQQDLEDQILKIWKEAGSVWNNGKFAELMREFFILIGFKVEECQVRIGHAFNVYCATNMKSEDCLRGAVKEIFENKDGKYILSVEIQLKLENSAQITKTN